MVGLLLALIYIAFISLGLPDSLLGAAWPAMRLQMEAPVYVAGLISMVIAGGTIVSSLLSQRLGQRLGTGLVTAISVLATALALLGFSLSQSLLALFLFAIPYGLGAGAIDAALNHYVAQHYAARHMSWLHSFWGVGAAISPAIMGAALVGSGGWQGGYRVVALIQLALSALLFLALPLWHKAQHSRANGQEESRDETTASRTLSIRQALNIPGVPSILLAFLSYCAMETTTGLWASTYLVEVRRTSPEMAANFAALFYLGITLGRMANGFVADKVGDKLLIRFGGLVILLGTGMIMLPLHSDVLALSGLIVIGLGCAPVYPSIIHATPHNFGQQNAQAIIGIQMASAYTGSTLMPPLFGWLTRYLGVGLYPYYLAFFALLLLAMTEALNRVVRGKTI